MNSGSTSELYGAIIDATASGLRVDFLNLTRFKFCDKHQEIAKGIVRYARDALKIDDLHIVIKVVSSPVVKSDLFSEAYPLSNGMYGINLQASVFHDILKDRWSGKNIALIDLAKIISHEMIHVYQLAAGLLQLNPSGKLSWEGSTCDEYAKFYAEMAWCKRPWEQQATAHERMMAEKSIGYLIQQHIITEEDLYRPGGWDKSMLRTSKTPMAKLAVNK